MENEVQKSDVEEITAVVCYEYYDRYCSLCEIKHTFKAGSPCPSIEQLATRAYLKVFNASRENSWVKIKVCMYDNQSTELLGTYYFRDGEMLKPLAVVGKDRNSVSYACAHHDPCVLHLMPFRAWFRALLQTGVQARGDSVPLLSPCSPWRRVRLCRHGGVRCGFAEADCQRADVDRLSTSEVPQRLQTSGFKRSLPGMSGRERQDCSNPISLLSYSLFPRFSGSEKPSPYPSHRRSKGERNGGETLS